MRRIFLCGFAALCLVSVGREAVGAVAVPFTETFSAAGGTGFDFEPFTPDVVASSFAVTGGSYVASLSDGARSYSVVETSGITSTVGTKVTMSSDFVLTDTAEATTRLGFVVFGTTADIEPATDSTSHISASIAEPGGFGASPFFQVRIQPPSPALATTVGRLTPDPLNPTNPVTAFTNPNYLNSLTNDIFRLTLDTTVLSPTSLQFDYSLSNLTQGPSLGVQTGSITVATPFTPAGNFFGFFVDRNGTDIRVDPLLPRVAFDNFSISVTAVPEPSSFVLLALGTFGVVGFQRRRMASGKKIVV